MNQSIHPDLHAALDRLLRQVVILGTLAVLLIPAARGSSALIGWLPLWLMGGLLSGAPLLRFLQPPKHL